MTPGAKRNGRANSRSAPVPGRSDVDAELALEKVIPFQRAHLAAPGDGRTPPALRAAAISWRNFAIGHLLLAILLSLGAAGAAPPEPIPPHARQTSEQIAKLKSSSAAARARAAEALGFLRAGSAANALMKALQDEVPAVRVQAALTLGWCGGRAEVPALLAALQDEDWAVRQAAWVALTNLTGMEWPFDALASAVTRARQSEKWRAWWAAVPSDAPPREVLDLLVETAPLDRAFWHVERGLRALGALGGNGASDAVQTTIARYQQRENVTPAEAVMVQAGLRSLGRLRDPKTFSDLVQFLETPRWARYAAEALGDFGSEHAVIPLVGAYPNYALDLNGRNPKFVPPDDRPGFEAADRMYETPFEIAAALARLPITSDSARAALRTIAPLLIANLPSDFDGAMLYEPEAAQQITAHLVEVAGLRQAACAVAFASFGLAAPAPQVAEADILTALAQRQHGGIPHAAVWLPALCQEQRDAPWLIQLLEHKDGWVRINAAKALMFVGATSASEPLARILAASKTEAEHGYFPGYVFDEKVQGHDEYDDPPPRWREAYVRALGRLGATTQIPLLQKLLWDDRNALEIQHAAVKALDELGVPAVIPTLAQAESGHPFHSIRLEAREALWKRGLLDSDPREKTRSKNRGHAAIPFLPGVRPSPAAATPSIPSAYEHSRVQSDSALAAAGDGRTPSSAGELSIVFIKGPNRMPNRFQIDPWRQTYSTTDSGPTYRLGWNLYVLKPGGRAEPLTHFTDGYVADCEVSWDGRRVVFARRGGSNPWWHIWEIDVDGTGLRQVTRGPYHDVQANYLGDGRIVFATTRTGMRDEYHGYAATGLAVMNPDGSGIECIGFNLGRDNEPAILPDGRLVFSRLELFYSRLKTELTVQAIFPDGTKNVTLYGPERRDLWRQVTLKSGEKWWGEAPPRHRVLRLTQPQSLDDGSVVCATTGGLVRLGPGREREEFIPHDRQFAVTTPFALDDRRLLCAAVEKQPNDEEGNLALYEMELATGALKLRYHDPEAASFEPRPIRARQPPLILAETPSSPARSYTAQLVCDSVKATQLPAVEMRGKLLRVIEGMPVVGRHFTHRSEAGPAWKNHVGTHARVLGTVPLAADGSFAVEVPADRLLHLQVLDSDRRTVGNQQVWMYARPGEQRSCTGCHERPDTAPPSRLGNTSLALTVPPAPLLPSGDEFTYRAKAWQKETLLDETEEQTRTVRAVSRLGRR